MDRRKPDYVLLLRNPSMAGQTCVKVEIFGADQFPVSRFTTLQGRAITPNNLRNFVRLRVDGVWYPRRARALYTRKQSLKIMTEGVFNEIDKAADRRLSALPKV